MVRIRFALSSGGAGQYELTLNPSEVEIPESMKSEVITSINSLDGDTVNFEPYVDIRRGKLIWKGYPTNHVNFSTQLSILLTYVDQERYMDLGDVGDAIGVCQTYQRVKIIAIDRRLRPGGALIYDSVELVFEKCEGTSTITTTSTTTTSL